jgi:hypothetical protein
MDRDEAEHLIVDGVQTYWEIRGLVEEYTDEQIYDKLESLGMYDAAEEFYDKCLKEVNQDKDE